MCAAVGWAAPVPQPAGTFRRLAGRLGLSAQPGYPYNRDGFGVRLNHSEFVRADFHRGFPEAVHVTMGPPMVLRVWDAVSPLTALIGEWIME